jgi:hypothetical protein
MDASILEELWRSAPTSMGSFSKDTIARLPDAAQCYLCHAIDEGTALASTARLRMHGEIKLKRWLRYSAEQVICRGRGFIWRATVWMGIVPITGSDRLLNGEGAMRWNILGIVPVMAATGVDITRSVAGRTAAELVWLPSALLDEDVSWSATDPTHTRTAIAVEGESVDLNVAIEEGGRLKSLALSRWGNPDGGAFSYLDFGGIVEDEGTFGGYTIPTRLRIGYFAGSSRFESEGEFIRISIDDAKFR